MLPESLRATSRRDADLQAGELRLPLPEWVGEVFSRPAPHLATRYPEARGLSDLIDLYTARTAGTGAGPSTADSLLVTAGAKEALMLTMQALLAPGDSVLLPSPGWPSYAPLAEHIGAEVHTYTVDGDSGADWGIVSAIAAARPRVVVVNSPHNPTGLCLSEAAIARVCSAARHVGAVVIFDGVYRPLAAARLGAVPASIREGGHVYVDSVSKWLGMPGLRIGFLHAEPAVVRRALAVRSRLGGTTASVLAQHAVARVLAHPEFDALVKTLATQVDACLDVGARLIRSAGYEVVGRGGIYLWCRTPEVREAPLSTILIEGAAFDVSPGGLYGDAGYFRVCPIRHWVLSAGDRGAA